MKTKEAPGTRLLRMVQHHFPFVKTIKDADTPVIVTVRQSDISAAAKKAHNACVMAQACRRDMKADAALITISRAYIVFGDEAVRYDVSTSTQREIIAFDKGAAFSPGQYALLPVCGTDRLGAKKGPPPTERPRERSRRKPAVFTTGIRAMASGSGLRRGGTKRGVAQ